VQTGRAERGPQRDDIVANSQRCAIGNCDRGTLPKFRQSALKAILAEEFFGARADKMAAEAYKKGVGRPHLSVPKSAQILSPKQAPKRDDIVANLAKADGIKTTRYACKGGEGTEVKGRDGTRR